MKTTTLFFIFYVLSIDCFSQVNDDAGKLELSGSFITDNLNNLSGGKKTGSSVLSLFDLGIYYSFNKGLLKNTSIHTHIIKTAGYGFSENFIGDAQVASNIDGHAPHFVYQLLIRQQIAGFSLTAGMHDLNSDFMVSEFAGDFINSSFGIAPAITLNVPVSVFPVTTFGGLLSYENERLKIHTGIYNLNHYYPEEESFRFENHFFQHGFLGITEVSLRLNSDNAVKGEYKIGGYIKKCDHNKHEDSALDYLRDTDFGFYLLGDQVIHHFSGDRQLGAFVQLSLAPHTSNFASQYYGGGLSLRDLSAEWLPRQVGLAVGTVKLNHLFLNNDYLMEDKFETVIELTAQIPVRNYFTVQPDFQYIINPSAQYKDACTMIVRLMMDFEK